MTRIIRKNNIESIEKKPLITHYVSSEVVNFPSIRMIQGQTAPQIVYLKETDNNEYVGSIEDTIAVKRRIDIVLDEHGNVQDNNIIFPLGNKFDRYVTILHFDLSKLEWAMSSEANYLFKLCFFDEDFEVNKNHSFAGNYFENYEPIMYEFDGVDFYVPREITEKATRYQIVLIIQEILEDTTEGNVFEIKESFVSQIFRGEVQDNFYNLKMILPDEAPDISNNALKKSNISLILADDGEMAVNNYILGNNLDSYVKTFSLTKITSHLKDFNIYMVYNQGNKMYSSKVEDSIGWIPAEVTKNSGEWEVMIVAYKGEDQKDPDYFYTSSVIKMEVLDNFLNSAILNSSKVNVSLYSNFETADDNYMITSDGSTFFWDEE